MIGVASRSEVARWTGLSRSTVSSIVSDLQLEGVVIDRDGDTRPATGGGRPPALIALDPRVGPRRGRRLRQAPPRCGRRRPLARRAGRGVAGDAGGLRGRGGHSLRERPGRLGAGAGGSGPGANPRSRNGTAQPDPPHGASRLLRDSARMVGHAWRRSHGGAARAARARSQRRRPGRARRGHLGRRARQPGGGLPQALARDRRRHRHRRRAVHGGGRHGRRDRPHDPGRDGRPLPLRKQGLPRDLRGGRGASRGCSAAAGARSSTWTAC